MRVPLSLVRKFYLALPWRFEEILGTVRPILDRVFREWLSRPLDSDLWRDVKLAGFGVEDPVLRRLARRGSRSSAAAAVKLLVDMNLSPSWVDRLARHGFEAVQWSTIGAATAPDVEILTWANEHQFVVITNDLDFSAILAARAVDGPSVVQLRTQDLLSESAARIVVRALEAHRVDAVRQQSTRSLVA